MFRNCPSLSVSDCRCGCCWAAGSEGCLQHCHPSSFAALAVREIITEGSRRCQIKWFPQCWLFFPLIPTSHETCNFPTIFLYPKLSCVSRHILPIIMQLFNQILAAATLICPIFLGLAQNERVSSAEAPHRREYLYVGGEYAETPDGDTIFQNQMYVEKLSSTNKNTRKFPLVFIHGRGQSGTVRSNTSLSKEQKPQARNKS